MKTVPGPCQAMAETRARGPVDYKLAWKSGWAKSPLSRLAEPTLFDSGEAELELHHTHIRVLCTNLLLGSFEGTQGPAARIQDGCAMVPKHGTLVFGNN